MKKIISGKVREVYDLEDGRMVIVTTDDDNSNLFIGDVCNTIYEVPKIYIRLNDSDKVKLLVDSKIKAICPFLLSVEKFYEMYNE